MGLWWVLDEVSIPLLGTKVVMTALCHGLKFCQPPGNFYENSRKLTFSMRSRCRHQFGSAWYAFLKIISAALSRAAGDRSGEKTSDMPKKNCCAEKSS